MSHSFPVECRVFLNRPYNDNLTAPLRSTPIVNWRRLYDSIPSGLIFSVMAATVAIFLLLAIYAEFSSPLAFGQEPEMRHIEMKTELIKYGIIPDVISEVPKHLLEVMYGNHYMIYFGNKVNPDYLSPPPHTVTWPSDESKYHSVVMIDPDHPSRMHPTEREYLHWMVVNILDDNILSGLDVAEYYAPDPEPGSGPHRFIFMVFEQPNGKIDSKEPYSDVYHTQFRTKFSTRKFAEKYGFGNPIAINFFIGEKFLNSNTTTKRSPTAVES